MSNKKDFDENAANTELGEGEVEVYTLEDEEGEENDYILIKRMTIKGNDYVAFEPYYEDGEPEDEEEAGSFVILKCEKENDEEFFITIEDDKEFDEVAAIFEKELEKDLELEDDE